jgi:hypothetical protein
LMSREGERWEERPSVWSGISHRLKCFTIIFSGLRGKVLLYITIILWSSSCSIALSWVPTPPIFNPTFLAYTIFVHRLHHGQHILPLCHMLLFLPQTSEILSITSCVLFMNFWGLFLITHTHRGVRRDGDGSCVLDAFLSSFGALQLPLMVAIVCLQSQGDIIDSCGELQNYVGS